MSLNPRHRNLVGTVSSATTRANKPPLIKPNTGNTALDRWIDAATERFEIDDGARSRPLEQTITRRDLEKRLTDLGIIVPGMPTGKAGVPVIGKNGQPSYLSFDDFAESIRSTKLFRDLQMSIDDPTRFDGLADKTKQALLPSIAEEASKRGAAIRRLDDMFQDQNSSFAQSITEITASVAGSAAGLRRVEFASASANRSTAGIITQVQARLDNFSGGAPGTATVEAKMTAVADRATGLEAQFVVKVSTGGSVAGFGLASTTPVGGTPSSAFIIQANKFAIVDATYAGGLTNTPPASSIMFGVDSDGAYVGGNIKTTGAAEFDGFSVFNSANWTLTANRFLNVREGIFAYGNAIGMLGESITGRGVWGLANGAGGVGVRAEGTTALQVIGPMTIDNSTLVANLNAEKLGGNLAASFVLYTGTLDVGNPGTPTHALHCILGATAFRIPVLIP